jgi:(R,R)-butanediol dehydrogenase/meso-butanediol dehydrogenase/diacetyl reductase
MRAIQLHGTGDLRFADVPAPAAPGPGEVRLSIEAAGICGSDIHNFRTGQWISRSPSIPGHEFCGRVTAIGPGTEDVRVGDRVIADSRYWCGTCPACRAGNNHLCTSLGFVGEVCDGGFAEEAVIPARLLYRADPSIPAAVAATAEPLAVALHAVNRLAPVAGDTALVTGCGMIGALCALVLSHKGLASVRIADRNGARARMVAAATGATSVELDGAGLAGVTAVIEATGSTAVLRQVIDTMPGGGRIALVGIFHGGLDFNPTLLVERELALLGCHAFRHELPEAISLLKPYAGRIAQFLSPPVALEDVPVAYDRIIAGKAEFPKTIIAP